MNNSVLLVAIREIMEKIRDRAFILFTAFMLFLPISGAASSARSSPAPDTHNYRVGLVGEGPEQLGATLEVVAAVLLTVATTAGLVVLAGRPAPPCASAPGSRCAKPGDPPATRPRNGESGFSLAQQLLHRLAPE